MVEPPPSDNLYIWQLPPNFEQDKVEELFSAYGTVLQARSMPGAKSSGALVRFSSEAEATWIKDNLSGNIPEGIDTPIMVRYADTPETRAQRQGPKGMGKAMEKAMGKAMGKGFDPFFGAMKGFGFGPRFSPYGMKGGKKGGKDDGVTSDLLVKGLWSSGALPGGPGFEAQVVEVYVSGLPMDASDLTLYQIFAPFGAIGPKGVRAMCHPDGSCRGFGFVNYLEPQAAEAAIATLHGTQMPNGKTMNVSVKAPKGAGEAEVQATE
mmetsp:Transcript_3295/g.7784  ORF Transcript_3295/g.7784 Transcript_3295/m.7784 type:complete len:265 (+) Transcript_3295:95-889(+)